MGLATYSCTGDLPHRIPKIVASSGIRCEMLEGGSVEEDGETLPRFRLTRGLGTVEFSGYSTDNERQHFNLVCGRNPLLWFWDMRLLRHVESLCLRQPGVRKEGVPDDLLTS